MSPRPNVSAERKNQILEAAMAVFARKGFIQARMDDIAEEAGLSKGTLYLYFKSKDAIITALLKRFYTWYMEELRAVYQAEGSATERLLLLAQRIATGLKRVPGPLVSIAYEFYALAMRQKAVREYLRDYFREYRGIVANLIEEGIAAGEFHAIDAERAATYLTALYEGLALLWVIDPQIVKWGELSESATRLLLESLKARESDQTSPDK